MVTEAKTTLRVLDHHRQLYIDSLWRRLKYFDSVLDDKISNYNTSIQLTLGIQRRFILFLPGVDDIDEYIRQKLEDKAKQEKLKKRVDNFLTKNRPILRDVNPHKESKINYKNDISFSYVVFISTIGEVSIWNASYKGKKI